MYTPKFSAYKEAVVRAYHLKKATSQEDWLMRPTRHRLRQVCIHLVETGLQDRDKPMLDNYLKLNLREADYVLALKKKEPEDFRGFEQFLNNTDITTSEKNVELLAWLIDFPARPVIRFQTEEYDSSIKQTQEERTDTGGDTEKDMPNQWWSFLLRWQWRAGLAILIVSVAVAWLSTGSEKCMYWDKDHYVASDCGIPTQNMPLVKLDPIKLAGFKRLGRVDTLTSNSIGKLWYVRVKGKMEIYTSGGQHPLYPDKTLTTLNDYAVNVCRNQH